MIPGRVAAAAALALAVVLPTVAATQPSPSVELSTGPQELRFDTGQVFDGLRLRFGGPGDLSWEERGDAATALFVGLADAEGEPLPDGLYTYELRGRVEDREVLLRSGFFSIRDGAFVSPEAEEEPAAERRVAASGLRVTAEAQVIEDDLIVDGSLCVGFDCLDGEVFGFDTVRLKENNLRIGFVDTSVGNFPTTDWQIRANEETLGGAALFAIDELDAETTPFTILAGAPDAALFIDDGGNVGFGTSVPELELHVLDGDTPALRLEQDGSVFAAQTWDVAGNEVSFFIRDRTHSSRLPLRIFADSPANSLMIRPEGVGLGVFLPTAKLDVGGSIAVSGTVDGRDVSTDGSLLDDHVADLDNPHQVTAAQVGAEPAGAAASALAAHEAAFNHGNIPSALPVPVSQGGTGATDAATARANLEIAEDPTKAGILPAASFSGNPGTATVAFADPYPAGTSYVVLLTAVTTDAKKISTPNLLAKDETGFTVTLGSEAKNLVEVGWLARPVGE
jgi:hypothetical protein